MSKKLTQEQFIKKANLTHNDKYDYSKSIYINDATKLIITCKEHGDFEQVPNSHYRSGCPKCGLNSKNIKRRLDINELINRFISKHGDKYDYSKVIYVKKKSKIIITCKKHNEEFLQTPEKHLDSITGGCPKCNSIGKGNLTLERFLEKAFNIHKDKYDYSQTKIVNCKQKIKINCKEHGIFEQIPNDHLSGIGCSKCGKNYRWNSIELEEIYRNKYGNKYEYDFSNFKNCRSKIKVKCDIHSYFEISVDNLKNYGCTLCSKGSKGEEKISSILENKNIKYLNQKSFDDCKYINKLSFDFYLPEYNTCIEYDGKQHFESIEYFGGEESLKKQKIKDFIKDNFCLKNKINLVRIPYYDFDKIEKIIEEICQ